MHDITTADFEHSAMNSFSPGRSASGGTLFRASASHIFILWVRRRPRYPAGSARVHDFLVAGEDIRHLSGKGAARANRIT